MPGLEGRAFYPLFPTSFAKYFQMLSNIHSARMYAAQALFANEATIRAEDCTSLASE